MTCRSILTGELRGKGGHEGGEMHGEAMLQDWMLMKEGRGRVKQIKQS